MFEAATSGLTIRKITRVWSFESCQIFILMKCLKLPFATIQADRMGSPLTTLKPTFTDKVGSVADAYCGASFLASLYQGEAAPPARVRVQIRDAFCALPLHAQLRILRSALE